MSVMLPNVPYWQPALGRLGEFVTGLDELAQAIRIIITTPKGSVPHRPDFGCGLLAHMDAPQGLATARIIREVMSALEQWEPRIIVSKVEVRPTASGASTLRVFWYPTGTPTAERQAATLATEVATGEGASTAYLTRDEVGTPGGVAPLDAKGTVPEFHLPKILVPGAPGGDIPTSVDGGEIV